MKQRKKDKLSQEATTLIQNDCEGEFSDPDEELKAQDFKSIPRNSSSFFKRLTVGIAIFLAFALIIFMGHFYILLLIFLIQIQTFREIINLRRDYVREQPIKFSNNLNWFLFIICSLYIFCKYFAINMIFSKFILLRFIQNHRESIFFSLYIGGLIAFVLSLKKGFYKYQIRLFFWTHLSLLIVMAMSLTMRVTFEGIVWMFTPAVLVIINDSFAYFVGKSIGRHKLIYLSPNKTVEGFIGGVVASILICFPVG